MLHCWIRSFANKVLPMYTGFTVREGFEGIAGSGILFVPIQ
jgi:hypothetical protein